MKRVILLFMLFCILSIGICSADELRYVVYKVNDTHYTVIITYPNATSSISDIPYGVQQIINVNYSYSSSANINETLLREVISTEMSKHNSSYNLSDESIKQVNIPFIDLKEWLKDYYFPRVDNFTMLENKYRDLNASYYMLQSDFKAQQNISVIQTQMINQYDRDKWLYIGIVLISVLFSFIFLVNSFGGWQKLREMQIRL